MIDNAVPSRVAALSGLPALKPGMVLEGGAIDVNGGGTCYSQQKHCLLNPNRNPINESAVRLRRAFVGGLGQKRFSGLAMA